MVENQNDIPYLPVLLHRLRARAGEPLAGGHRRTSTRTGGEPCPNAGWGPDLQSNSIETTVANLDGADNYVALETEGRGHYVGCTLAVRHFQGSWWGEGDDMIFIDDDTWPPSLHGTGMEDYFGHAWGMQHNAYLFNGTIVHEEDVPGFHHSYRFHMADPIRFEKRIRVTFEHGHGNHLADEWSSTAYWYQTLPSPELDDPRRRAAAAPAPGRPRDRGRRCPS